MKTSKKIVVLVGVILIVVLLGLFIYYFVSDGESRGNLDLQMEGNLQYKIEATESDGAGVALNSGLNIVSKDETTLDGIKYLFNIEPAIPYKVTKLSSKEYTVSFENPLTSNTVYRVSMVDEDSKFSWAFQTVKDFKLESTLPRDKGLGVPLDTGIEFTYSYPNFESLDNFFSIEPMVKGKFIYNKNQAVFMPDKNLDPDTVYTVSVKSGLTLKESNKKITDDYTFQFMTVANRTDKTYLNFTETLYNFTSDTVPYLEVHPSEELRNQEVKVEIYQYSEADSLIVGLKELIDTDLNWMNSINKTIKLDGGLKKITSFNTKFQTMQNNWTHYLVFPEELDEGYYLINVTNGKSNYQTHLQVNNAAIYIMLGEKESLAWVNDTQNGKPIPGAKLVAENGRTAITNAEGIALINEQVVKLEEFNQQYFKVEINNRPTYVAQLLKSFYGYDYSYGYQSSNAGYWSYLYFDRDLYQQNDTVNLWGLVKARESGTKLNKLTATLNMSSNLGDKVEVMKTELTLDEFGTFDEKLAFNNLIPGSYYIEIKNDDALIIGKSFEIRNYKKPAYMIEADFNKDVIFAWDNALLNIKANFFEGSPVTGLNLKATYYEERTNRNVGKIVTDRNGNALINYRPIITAVDWMPIYVNFNIINDQAEDQNIWENAEILVFPKDIMVNIAVSDGEIDSEISIATNLIDLNKSSAENDYGDYTKKYKGKEINRPINVQIIEIEFVKEVTGNYYDFINKRVVETYNYNRVERQVEKFTAETLGGVYQFNYQFAQEADYEIIVETTDTRGNIVVHSNVVRRFMNDYNDFAESIYTLEEADENKYNYRINDEISLKLMKNGLAARELNEDRLLMLKLKDGLRDYSISDKTENSYTFKKEDIPNFYYEAAYFDGKRIYLTGIKGILYDYSEKNIKIDAVADKSHYKPGDTAKLNFTVKDKKGNPLKASLNISIVDEAMFALSDQFVDTAESVYSYVFTTGILAEYASSQTAQLKGGAEMGGDGGYADYVRSEFKDTAEFRTLTTDKNGRATLTFQVPDNLTSWRVTYQAITKDLLAGNGKTAVNVQLPFFTLLIANEKYLVGDTIAVSVRSYGTATKTNETVEYLLTLTDQQGKETKLTTKGRANDYSNIEIGKLPKGKYTLQVESKQGSLSDGIKKEFSVEDTLLKTNIIDYYDLENGMKITNTDGYANLRFYSKSNSLFYKNLTSLAYTTGSRVDQILARKIGPEILNKHFSEENISTEKFELDQYQTGDGGISLLPYSENEALLSAKVASIASELIDKSALKFYFNEILINKNSSGIDQAAAYWGLAALNEPFLLDVQNAAKEQGLSIKEQVLLAVALAEFGDLNSANQIYIKLMNKYGKRVGEQVYIETGIDKDDVLEATSLLAIVAAKLDSDERYRMFDYLTNNQTDKILTLLEQLIFMKNDIPKTDKRNSFDYTLNGEKETVNIEGSGRFSLILSPEEIKTVSFSNVKGDLTVAVSYYGKLEEAGIKNSDSYSLERFYKVNNKPITELALSDIVKITLEPSFSANAPDGYYEITDCLPAGFRYIENSDMRTRGMSLPIYSDTERIVFGYYHSKNAKNDPLTYYARVASIGEYAADTPVMQHFASGSLTTAPQERFIINEIYIH